MPDAILSHVRLEAVYAAVPEREICIEDELEHYGGSRKKAERARKIIGTDRRRVALPGLKTSDLCLAAAKRLLDERNVDRASVDALILVTQSPDFELPATACRLQEALGLSRRCAAFDVNQGCSGYVYGLWMAAGLIASGACAKVLLLAGDAAYIPRPITNRIIAPIFGDGGSASLLTREEGLSLAFTLGTDGSGYKHIIIPGGRAALPYRRIFEENKEFFEDIVDASDTAWRLNEVFMNGSAIFDFTLNTIPEHINNVLHRYNLSPENIDWLFLHQANKQIVESIADKVGFAREKAPSVAFSRYGNLSSASIPASLCEHFGQKGNSGGAAMLLCGYGVGLSWASCLVRGQHVACAPVINVPNGEDDTQGAMRYWRNFVQSPV